MNQAIGAWKDYQATERQKALQDQDTNMKLASMGINANTQDLRDYQNGNYIGDQTKAAVPAQAAIPAVQAQAAQPAQGGQAISQDQASAATSVPSGLSKLMQAMQIPDSSKTSQAQVGESGGGLRMYSQDPSLLEGGSTAPSPARPAISAQAGQAAIPGQAAEYNDNPYLNYTDAKKAQMARDVATTQLTLKNTQSNIDKNNSTVALNGSKAQKTDTQTDQLPDQLQLAKDKLAQQQKIANDNAAAKVASDANDSSGNSIDLKTRQAYGKAYDPLIAAGRSTLKIENAKIVNAQHGMAIVQKYGDDMSQVSPQDRIELASVLASSFSPTGNPSSEQIHDINQKTIPSKLGDIYQWATGRVAPTNSAQLTGAVVDALKRQGSVSAHIVDNQQQTTDAIYANEQRANPAAFDAIKKHASVRLNYPQYFTNDNQSVQNSPANNTQPGIINQDAVAAEMARRKLK